MTTTNTVLVRTALHKKYYKVFLSDFYIKIVHVLYWYLARGTLGQDKLPFFSSRRTYFRPGLPHSRAQDVSAQGSDAGQTAFSIGFPHQTPPGWPGPTQEYRMVILVTFIRFLRYSAGTWSQVSSPVRCRDLCCLKNRTFFKSSS